MYVCTSCLENFKNYEVIDNFLICECSIGEDSKYDPTDNCQECGAEVYCGARCLTHIRFLDEPMPVNPYSNKKAVQVDQGKIILPVKQESYPTEIESFEQELQHIRQREEELVEKIKQSAVMKKFSKECFPKYQPFVAMHKSDLEQILEETQEDVAMLTDILKTYDNLKI